MAPQPRMRLEGISRHWGSVRSLDKVSFSINRGEVIALLGDNGAGKSTLIKTLSGACQPSEGQLCRDEVAVNLTSPRKAMDAGISVVFPDLAVVPMLSIFRDFFWAAQTPARPKSAPSTSCRKPAPGRWRAIGWPMSGYGSMMLTFRSRPSRAEKGTLLNTPVQATTSLLENGSLLDVAARSWSYITLGYGHGEEWWRVFCYRLSMAGYDGWLSIEHEDAMLSRREGLIKSINLLKNVAPTEASDFKPQDIGSWPDPPLPTSAP